MAENPRRSKRRRAGNGATLLLAASILLPVVLFGATAWFDRVLMVQQGRQQILASASALNEQARNSVQLAGLMIDQVVDHVGGQDWPTLNSSQEVHDYLANLKAESPAIDSVFLVDRDGFNSASSRTFPMPRYDDRDREYFTAAVAGERGLVVAAPFISQSSGSFGFTITRARIVNGQFDGLVGVTLSPAYFEAFYRSVVQSPSATLAILVRQDGKVLVRYPASGNTAPTLTPGSPLLEAVQSGAMTAFFTGQSRLLGGDVMGAYMRTAGQPVFVSVILRSSVFLAQWYLHLAILVLFALVTGVALFTTTRGVLRRADRTQTSLDRLIEETDRRREAEDALRQAQKMEAIGQLTGGLAHDFNNLLQGIIGLLDVMQTRIKQNRTADLERLIGNAMAGAHRAAALTHRLLAFARRQPLDPRPVDVNNLIGSMEDLLRRTMGEHIEIVFALGDGMEMASCDPNQLESSLLNLAINARDAMPDGGRLTIATSNVHFDAGQAPGPADTGPGDYVCLSVADGGIGMAPNVLERAFDPFYTTKPTGQGTGLGLSMVYGFVRQSEGRISIQSQVGRGTEVKMYLPRLTHQAFTPEPAPLEPASPPAPGQSAGETLLVVEDEAAVRELILESLQDLGYRILEAADGPAGLRILETGVRVDLLVTDIGLPGGLNGRQMADAARVRRPDLRVLLMTGYAESAARGAGFLPPGMALIAKPFTLEALTRRIREMLATVPAGE